MSVLIVIIFAVIGSGLALPLLPGNMKVKEGFTLWNKDQRLALTSFTEATLTGPDQAIYHDILGSFAFIKATQANTDPVMKSTLMDIGESAGNTAIEIEPQLAIWRYRQADREMYRILDGNTQRKTDILHLYKEADQLFPGNALILNKWALALMLSGDYGEAGQKLVEAGKADPVWSQTSFYGGLLNCLEGHREAAGEMFVLPGKGHARTVRTVLNGLNDIDYFIDFCGQAANYGVIGRVADDLEYYADDKGDWMAWTFLGIADIFTGR